MSSRTTDYGGLLKDIRASELQKVQVAVADIDGILRGKYIHKDKFLKAAETGFGFCNVVFGWDSADVCYDNSTYTGWHTGYPDAQVRLDLGSCRRLPWDMGSPFFLGDFVTDSGEPLAVCPRALLKRMIDRVYQAGFLTKSGVEFEWFNFHENPQSLADKGYINPKPITPGMFGYSLLRSGYRLDYFSSLMDNLEEFDVPLEGLHTETGPGVYEAAIMAADALEAADRAVLFKTAVKKIAYNHGIIASFMARWNQSLPGCSGHIHMSLMHSDNTPAFYDPNDPHKMSDTFKHFLAGQLHCLPYVLLMYASNVNSYKRLVEGFWAPTRVSWGVDNRTVAMRVIKGSAGSTRLENRVGGSDINPYLALAASLASGLYGIENKLSLDSPPIEGNGYTRDDLRRLPKDLSEATEVFRNSEITRQLFGSEFVEHFAATRDWEWRKYNESITDWETKRYFEII